MIKPIPKKHTDTIPISKPNPIINNPINREPSEYFLLFFIVIKYKNLQILG